MNILEKSRMRTNQNSEQRSKSDTNCQPLTHPHRSISQDPNSSYRSSSSRALAFDQKKLPTPVELLEIPCEMKHGILGEVKANEMMDQHRTKTNGANLSRSSILFFKKDRPQTMSVFPPRAQVTTPQAGHLITSNICSQTHSGQHCPDAATCACTDILGSEDPPPRCTGIHCTNHDFGHGQYQWPNSHSIGLLFCTHGRRDIVAPSCRHQ